MPRQYFQMIDLKQYSTSGLYRLAQQVQTEIERRREGYIPENLACSVCGHECEGDRYEFDENAVACDVCYHTSDQVKKDVAEWQTLLERHEVNP